RNPFNLNGRTLRFIPSPDTRAYRYELGPGSYDESATASGTIVENLRDDDSREFQLSFGFRFFGVENRSFYLNSDGNITFGAGDAEITDRSLGRFLSGPPRIAALFRDLDPNRSGSVRVQNEANRAVITWAQ